MANSKSRKAKSKGLKEEGSSSGSEQSSIDNQQSTLGARWRCSRLMSDLIHQLSQPLTLIGGLLESAMPSCHDHTPYRSLLERLLRDVDRISRQVHRIREMTEIGFVSDRGTLNPHRLSEFTLSPSLRSRPFAAEGRPGLPPSPRERAKKVRKRHSPPRGERGPAARDRVKRLWLGPLPGKLDAKHQVKPEQFFVKNKANKLLKTQGSFP